jgi:hypothetical protein
VLTKRRDKGGRISARQANIRSGGRCGNHHAFPVEVGDGFFGHAEIIGQQVNSNPIRPNRATARKSSPKNPVGSSSLATVLMNVGMVPLYGCCFGKAGANDKR